MFQIFALKQNISPIPIIISGQAFTKISAILSGLENGDTVVAEGLKKTRPNGKIKPIKYGTKQKASSWKKKGKPAKTETKKSKFDWLKKLNPFKKSETEKK